MVKRILAIFLIMILVMSPVSVYASSSGSLTVASGSGSAVGGLFSDYGVNSKTSAIALTLVLLNSLGATVKLTDQAIQAGKKVEDVIMDKFAQWVGGSSAESMTEEQREELKKRFKVINGGNGSSGSDNDQGTNIGPDGKVYFGLGALGILTEFIKYLQSKNDIQEVPATEPVSYVDLGFCTTVLSTVCKDSVNHGNDWNVREFSKPCAVFKMTDNGIVKGYAAFCKKSFTMHQYDYYPAEGNTGNDIYRTVNVQDGFAAWWSASSFAITDFDPENAFVISSSDVWDVKSKIKKWDVTTVVPGVTQDGIYADDLNTDLIDNNDGKPIVVDPELLPNVSPDTDQQVSIPDYLQYILDNANANASTSQDPLEVPVTDPVTLSPGTLTVPVQEQDPIQQPLPAEYTTPEDTPVNPVQDPSTPVEPGDAVPRLTFPLDEYFPFCIPFDIYALLSKFTAEPVTPVFDVGFTEPFTNSEVNLHIDLTPWNGVATAIRTAELGAFIVGLALLSKQIFTRG